MELQIGKEYIIEHTRKGVFRAKLIADHGEFIEVEVTKGRAHFTSFMNQARGVTGDRFSIRKTFCSFKEAY